MTATETTWHSRFAAQREAWNVSSFMQEAEVGEARLRFRVASAGDALRASLKGEGISEGDKVVQLFVGGTMVMSDSTDEYFDHIDAIRMAEGRVLINGLGLGCYLHTILGKPEVTHVDVVEISQDVLDLVGPYYAADPRVSLICADAFEQAKLWPVGTLWDCAWHDIWPYKTTDNLPEMARLARSYGRRCSWQGCWSKEQTLAQRRRYGSW